MHGAPQWLVEVVTCPVDAAPLDDEGGSYRCRVCGRRYPVDEGIVELLPAALEHLGQRGGGRRRAAGEGGAAGEEVAWISDEMDWWNPYYERAATRPLSPRAGLRGRGRERHLFRHVRARVGARPTVVEMGAGSSRTVAGLWAPGEHALRYVATDLSRPGLLAGAAALGPDAAAVQCDAGSWPFPEGGLDVVLILGVLHHLPDWQEALRRACASVRPGGYVLLHEVVWKPRILARRRAHGITDPWTSPHEGKVLAGDLRRLLEERGTVLRWRRGYTPLQFAILHYGDLHERLEGSRVLTVGLDVLDQAFGHTLGRVRPSLGFAEVMCVWRRERDHPASASSTLDSSTCVPPGRGRGGWGRGMRRGRGRWRRQGAARHRDSATC